MGWLNTLVDEAKFAHDINHLGPAYYITSQAKKDLRKQGKEDEAKLIEKAEAIGTVGGAIAGLTLGKGVPLITKGISAFRTAFPKVATGIDFVLTADGIRNLATENGILKTVNYAKDGNWGRAAASGTMDALDLLGGVGLVGDMTRYSKKASNRFLESLIRIGDNFSSKPISSSMTLLFGNRAKGLRYVLFNNPELAYQLPYDYSGQNILADLIQYNSSPAHKGDLIDVLFGKNDELVDTNGCILARMSTDISNIPEKTILAFQTIPGQSNKLPKVLKFNPGESAPLTVYRPILSNGDLVKGIPLEIARASSGGVDFATIPLLPSFGIDPGHFGVTALKNNNGVTFFGHDVYHFSPKLYAKRNRLSKLIPKLNITAGQPFIAEWQIPKINSFLNSDIKMPTIPVEGVDYSSHWHKLVPHTPSEFSYLDLFLSPNIFGLKPSSLLHKSGGTIKIKKKNIGTFTRYCKGKVTEECIRKGKNSSNPTTRKRANFAWVARHKFKHEEGGKINYLNYFK